MAYRVEHRGPLLQAFPCAGAASTEVVLQVAQSLANKADAFVRDMPVRAELLPRSLVLLCKIYPLGYIRSAAAAEPLAAVVTSPQV